MSKPWESPGLSRGGAVKILAEHVARGVIVSPRASAALEPGNAAA